MLPGCQSLPQNVTVNAAPVQLRRASVALEALRKEIATSRLGR
jgi:hypothetical protein